VSCRSSRAYRTRLLGLPRGPAAINPAAQRVTQECPIHAPRWRKPYRQKAIRPGQNGCAARDPNPRIKSGPLRRSGRAACTDSTRNRSRSNQDTGIWPVLVPRSVPRPHARHRRSASRRVTGQHPGNWQAQGIVRVPCVHGRPRGEPEERRRGGVAARITLQISRQWRPALTAPVSRVLANAGISCR
jgi:hypothetical protein